METFVESELESDTVTPPVGAGEGNNTGNGADWPGATLTLDGRIIVPPGRPPEMVRLMFALATCCGLLASRTVKVMLVGPVTEGVPEMTPVDPFNDSPAGNAVEVHVYGDVPPTADNVAEYEEPTAPLGSEAVATLTGPLTVKFITTSAILTPLACSCVVPELRILTVTRVAGILLPSQKKFTGVCTVATLVFDELMLIGIPSSTEKALLPGTVANNSKLNCSCWPIDPTEILGVSHPMTAPT